MYVHLPYSCVDNVRRIHILINWLGLKGLSDGGEPSSQFPTSKKVFLFVIAETKHVPGTNNLRLFCANVLL